MENETIKGALVSETNEQKPVSFVKMWLKDHLTLIFVMAAILMVVIIFFVIRFFNNANHPLTIFMNASAKDFNSSFSFEMEVSKNGKPVMQYTGAYTADSAKQNLSAVYDADYGDYSYTGVIYAEDDTRICGSLYDDKWRARDCSEKVLDFFDFNTDYRSGGFDGASFLRFTDLTYQFSADELTDFMKLFKSRMSGNTPLAKVKIVSENGAKTYTYVIDTEAFFDLVRDKGASIFYSVIEYDSFCALYKTNKDTVRNSDCILRYTVDSAGWMSDFYLSLTVDGSDYTIHCTMDDFGKAEVTIPEEFFEAEVLE